MSISEVILFNKKVGPADWEIKQYKLSVTEILIRVSCQCPALMRRRLRYLRSWLPCCWTRIHCQISINKPGKGSGWNLIDETCIVISYGSCADRLRITNNNTSSDNGSRNSYYAKTNEMSEQTNSRGVTFYERKTSKDQDLKDWMPLKESGY